jgi:hypothetical protein
MSLADSLQDDDRDEEADIARTNFWPVVENNRLIATDQYILRLNGLEVDVRLLSLATGLARDALSDMDRYAEASVLASSLAYCGSPPMVLSGKIVGCAAKVRMSSKVRSCLSSTGSSIIGASPDFPNRLDGHLLELVSPLGGGFRAMIPCDRIQNVFDDGDGFLVFGRLGRGVQLFRVADDLSIIPFPFIAFTFVSDKVVCDPTKTLFAIAGGHYNSSIMSRDGSFVSLTKSIYHKFLAFRPGTDHIAGGGYLLGEGTEYLRGIVQIYDHRTAEVVGTFRPLSGQLENVTYSPCGKYLLVLSCPNVEVRDADTLEVVANLKDYEAGGDVIACSPKGYAAVMSPYLCTPAGCGYHTVMLWSIATGAVFYGFNVPGQAQNLAFAADGSTLLVELTGGECYLFTVPY